MSREWKFRECEVWNCIVAAFSFELWRDVYFLYSVSYCNMVHNNMVSPSIYGWTKEREEKDQYVVK